MIQLKNQYVLKLDLEEYKDFVQVQDLIDLLYVEDSAMTLPIIEISFVLRNKKLLGYLNEGSILTVGLGKDELSMLDIKFRIVTDLSKTRPNVGDVVKISGVFDDYSFTMNQIRETYPKMSSLDVVNRVAKKYFPKVKTNLTKTNDIQNWYQHTDSWTFLSNVCSQGYLSDDTFLVSGFDNDTFYYYDFKQRLKSAVNNKIDVWNFSKTKTGKSIINYAKLDFISNSGATSRVLGYNPTIIEYNWRNYETKAYKDSYISLTNIDSANIPIYNNVKSTIYRNLGSNNYSDSNRALTQNARNMILNSNVVIFVSVGGQFKKLKLLDIALIDETGDNRIRGYNTITKIAYQIKDCRLFTNITMVRESFNNIKGELK